MKRLLFFTALLLSIISGSKAQILASPLSYSVGMEWFYHYQFAYMMEDRISISYNRYSVERVENTDLGQKATILKEEYSNKNKISSTQRFYIYTQDGKQWIQQEGENKPLTLFHDPTMSVGDAVTISLVQKTMEEPFTKLAECILSKKKIEEVKNSGQTIERVCYEIFSKKTGKQLTDYDYYPQLGAEIDFDMLTLSLEIIGDDMCVCGPPGDAFLRAFFKDGECLFENNKWKNHPLYKEGHRAVYEGPSLIGIEGIENPEQIAYDGDAISAEGMNISVYAPNGVLLSSGRNKVDVSGLNQKIVIVRAQGISQRKTLIQKMAL